MSISRYCWLLLGLLLVGCETTARKPEPVPTATVAPRPVPLETRWQQSRDQLDDASLFDHLTGRSLQRTVKRAATTRRPLATVVASLNAARSQARQARAIVSGLLGYRKAGGVQFGREERLLWRRLATALEGEAEEITESTLLRARHSLAVQTGRAWFHYQAIDGLYRSAVEARELHQQIVARHQTGNRLERTDRETVLAARKALARVDARVRRLERAKTLAARALSRLTGSEIEPADASGGVKTLPSATLSRFLQREDIRQALARLEVGSQPMAWPELQLTTRHEGITRNLSRLARLKGEKLLSRLGLKATGTGQEKQWAELADTLHRALAEAVGAIYQVRQLASQHQGLAQQVQQAKREVNRLRARYSARRADLLDILQAQAKMADLSGRAAYVERRLHDQRLRAGLALGLF